MNNGQPVPEINEQSLEINSIISKKKYLNVKVYAMSMKANIRVKYFPLEGLN